MNWWTIFQLALTVAGSIESILAAIQAGQSATTPPINTYIEGKHGSVTVTWTPLP